MTPQIIIEGKTCSVYKQLIKIILKLQNVGHVCFGFMFILVSSFAYMYNFSFIFTCT